MKNKTISFLNKIEYIIQKVNSLGIDVSDSQEKYFDLKKMIEDHICRIVLLGSFSDGKTTTMAAMMDRLEDSMKIDSDESSDELKIYRPDGLKKGFEFVDTPGLFGTKEKEVDGKIVKFSDVTKKYLSEAHIVLYVCDAVVPLKDSHAPIIKWIMRDLNKLDNAIFVINKMDETGYDISDPEEYEKITKIKKNNIIKRLRDVISLNDNEADKLNIACIAANPYGKGLEYWLEEKDDYIANSHIDVLKTLINSSINGMREDEIMYETVKANFFEILSLISKKISDNYEYLNKEYVKIKKIYNDIKKDLDYVDEEINEKLKNATESLELYRAELLSELTNKKQGEFEEFCNVSLGVENNQLTLYVVNNKIINILDDVENAIVLFTNENLIKISKKNLSDDTLGYINEKKNEFLGNFKTYLKDIKVTNKDILKTRDRLERYNLTHKRYHGREAINKAERYTQKINTYGPAILSGLEAGLSVLLKMIDDAKFEKMKSEIQDSLVSRFKEAFDFAKDKSQYRRVVVPEYEKMVENCNNANEQLKQQEIKNQQFLDCMNEIDMILRGENR